MRLQIPSSGGYGDPFTRAPDAVAEDYQDGLLTLEEARTGYAVILEETTGSVDEPGTVALRGDRALDAENELGEVTAVDDEIVSSKVCRSQLLVPARASSA